MAIETTQLAAAVAAAGKPAVAAAGKPDGKAAGKSNPDDSKPATPAMLKARASRSSGDPRIDQSSVSCALSLHRCRYLQELLETSMQLTARIAKLQVLPHPLRPALAPARMRTRLTHTLARTRTCVNIMVRRYSCGYSSVCEAPPRALVVADSDPLGVRCGRCRRGWRIRLGLLRR